MSAFEPAADPAGCNGGGLKLADAVEKVVVHR
jgi:hypothetical protein